MPQYRVLAILAGGSAAASGLAKSLDVRPPSVTALIDGLVARGLVDRRQEDSDRRRVALRITEEGTRLVAEADIAVNEQLAHIAGVPAEQRRGHGPALTRALGSGPLRGPRGPQPGGRSAGGW